MLHFCLLKIHFCVKNFKAIKSIFLILTAKSQLTGKVELPE